MPGIVGLFTKEPREWAEPQLNRMVEAIRHESFYTAGMWISERLGVYVGWVARRNSFCDGMPLRNEGGDTVLVFSGEEYPEPGIIRRLKDRGHSLEEEGPSYLVHLYEDDPAFPLSLNGRFHGLVTDQTRGTATLFNDRYGMHRIYYHESKDAFYFAAEGKAILAVRPDLRSVDPRGLGEFAACGCVLEDRTVFKDIYALPGGSRWVFHNGASARKGAYFSPTEWEEQAPLTQPSFYQELRDSFARNLPRYFNGRERVGMTLTGGLDTRVIMAWHKAVPGSLPCYTFGGELRDCQDVRVARQVASVCQQPHEVLTVGDEFLSRFPHYAERSIYLAEGGVDVSRSSDLYISEKAREIAPAKVVGTYGSEIIRHAVMFKPAAPAPELYSSDFLSCFHQAGEAYARLRRVHPVTFAAFCQSPWHHFGVVALEESQLTVRCPYLDNDFVRNIFRAPKLDSAEDVRWRLICDGNPDLGRIRSDRGIGGKGRSFAALAARALLEFTFKAEYAYDYGMPPWLAKIDHVFSSFHFERLFLGWHKLLHFRIWYKGALAEYVRQILLDPRTLSRPYLNPKRVEALLQSHTRGEGNYTLEIHRLLSLELLHRLFLESR